MNTVELVVLSLRAIATMTSDPRLGGGGMPRERAADMLQILAVLVDGGDRVHDQLKSFAEAVSQMAENNIQPTKTHLEALRARSQAATDALEKRAAELGMSAPPDPASTGPDPSEPPIQ